MLYLNIIEHDLDESYLKSILFGIVVKVTPEVVVEVLSIPLVDAPSVSELEITLKLLDRVSIDLWGKVHGQLGSIVHIGSISRHAWVLTTFLTHSIYPFSHQADICKRGYILLSRILHQKPINLATFIIDKKYLEEILLCLRMRFL